MNDPKQTRKIAEALPERLMKKFLESVGEVFDKKLGRNVDEPKELTTSSLIERMKRAIDEKVRDEGRKGLFAPHLLKLKIEWGTHSEAPPEIISELENEILAAAIDHINDNRYRTLDKVKVETIVDIFTTGVNVVPTFGEFEEQFDETKENDEKENLEKLYQQPLPVRKIIARVLMPTGARETELMFQPDGKRLSVGRAKDNHLFIDNSTVSKIHAALLLNREGTLLVADTGSTNGTYINGRRMSYGEARQIDDGDVVSFGEIEVRFRKES